MQVLWSLAPALLEMAMMCSEALLGLAALVILFGNLKYLKGLVKLPVKGLRGCWNWLANPDVQQPEGPEGPGDDIPEGPGRLDGTGSSEGRMTADASLHVEFGEGLTNMVNEVLKKESDKEALNQRRARWAQEHFFLKRTTDVMEMVDAQGRYYCTVCALWVPDEPSWQQHLQTDWHAQRRTLHRTWARDAIEALEEKEALGAHEIQALKNVAAKVELSDADQEALKQRRERLFYEHYFMKQDEDLCAKGLWMDRLKVPETLLEMEQ